MHLPSAELTYVKPISYLRFGGLPLNSQNSRKNNITEDQNILYDMINSTRNEFTMFDHPAIADAAEAQVLNDFYPAFL